MFCSCFLLQKQLSHYVSNAILVSMSMNVIYIYMIFALVCLKMSLHAVTVLAVFVFVDL